jgi:hypothetical protein
MRLARLAGIAGVVVFSGSVGCGDQGPKESSSTAPPANGVYSLIGASRGAIPLVVDSIDETKRTLLPGNTRPEVRPEFDRGPVDDSLRLDGMQLQLRRSSEHEQVADRWPTSCSGPVRRSFTSGLPPINTPSSSGSLSKTSSR